MFESALRLPKGERNMQFENAGRRLFSVWIRGNGRSQSWDGDPVKGRSSTRTAVLAAVVAVLAWGTWGCYTALRHPVLRGSLTGESETTTVSFGDDCWQCHSSRQEVFWPDESGIPTEGYYDWDFFYSVPWWVDSFYYSQRPTAAEEERLPEPRRFRTRNQPVMTGAPAVSAPPSGPSIVARKRSEPGNAGSAPLAPTDPRRKVGRRGSGANAAAEGRAARRQTRENKEE